MDDAAHIEHRFSAYLGTGRLARFTILASGWETTVYEFCLATPSDRLALPAAVPLVMRLYRGSQAAAKAAREYRVMAELARVKFPVPRPYWFEPEPAPAGAPFLVMDRLGGEPLLQLHGFVHASRCFLAGFAPFVRTHARLHRLAPQALDLSAAPPLLNPFPAGPPQSLLQRLLATIGQRVAQGPLPGLRPALEWAREQAGGFEPATASLLHLDYHPLNVVVRGARLLGVIDWVSADVGDRHLDVATTAAIISSSAMEQPRWMADNRRGGLLRRLYAGLYVALYNSQTRLDFRRLRYYQAVAALFRLSTLGMMCQAGAESVGYRAQALEEVTPAVLRLLARYAEKKSGIPIRLDRPHPA